MTLSGFLIEHGSALILPLAVIEGPVVSIVTGFLAAQGYFNWYWALLLLICGDLIGDLIYYCFGRIGISPLTRLGRFLGLRGAPTPAFQHELKRNATKMLLVGKWTHAIGCLVLVGSGMMRLSLPHFVLVNLLATMPKSALLLSFGYLAGNHYSLVERHYILGMGTGCIAGIGAIVLIFRRTDGIWAKR